MWQRGVYYSINQRRYQKLVSYKNSGCEYDSLKLGQEVSEGYHYSGRHDVQEVIYILEDLVLRYSQQRGTLHGKKFLKQNY
jgi:hypothetical protein